MHRNDSRFVSGVIPGAPAKILSPFRGDDHYPAANDLAGAGDHEIAQRLEGPLRGPVWERHQRRPCVGCPSVEVCAGRLDRRVRAKQAQGLAVPTRVSQVTVEQLEDVLGGLGDTLTDLNDSLSNLNGAVARLDNGLDHFEATLSRIDDLMGRLVTLVAPVEATVKAIFAAGQVKK